LEIDESSGQYVVKGGKTILGRIFAYQEKTGMSLKEVLKMPYIMFVISMLDAPSIDYESKKRKTNSLKDADAEMALISGALS
jgi:hypothetical protein